MQYFISHSSILSIAFALRKKSILCPKCTFSWTALLPCPLYISKWNVITYFSQGNETAFRIKSFIHTVISFVKKVLAHTNFYSGYTLSKPAWFFFPTIKIFKDDVNCRRAWFSHTNYPLKRIRFNVWVTAGIRNLWCHQWKVLFWLSNIQWLSVICSSQTVLNYSELRYQGWATCAMQRKTN